jgi:hypothetical protein
MERTFYNPTHLRFSAAPINFKTSSDWNFSSNAGEFGVLRNQGARGQTAMQFSPN